MTQTNSKPLILLNPNKFRDPDVTADAAPRAKVPLRRLDTLWFNTGTLCNIECANCYIESSPTNDRLAFLTVADVRRYLDEIERDEWGTELIGFTGGEPFVNPQMIDMLDLVLSRGFDVLVLTNAMRPMMRFTDRLAALHGRHGDRLLMRISIDHHTRTLHEQERGEKTWAPMMEGVRWLIEHDFRLSVAGRTCWGESLESARQGYAALFADLGLQLDVNDPEAMVLFPEMDDRVDVPEITTACWGILDKSPDSVMCANSRMVVKRSGAHAPVVLACTLIPYEKQFERGHTLAEASGDVSLNHPHCARFCVLGGGACAT